MWQFCYFVVVQLVGIIFLLLLGLLNPVAGNPFDLFWGFFIFGLVTLTVLTSSLKLVVGITTIGAWLIFSQIKTANWLMILSTFSGMALGYVLARLKLLDKLAVWVLIIVFLVDAMVISRPLRDFLNRDLPLGTYNNDPGVFLKTYQLMSQGVDYYDAFKTAQLGRFAQQYIPNDIWGWRLPTIWQLWLLVPGKNDVSIYYLYLIFAVFLIYGAFLTGRRYLGRRGILSSYLLFPYLHFGSRDAMFLETEWWSVSLFILGIYFLTGWRLFWATVFLSLAVLIREVYVLPITLLMIYALISKRKLLPSLAIPLAAFGLLFLFHLGRVNAYIDAWGTLFLPRLVPNGLFFVQQTLAFGSWEYLLFGLRPLAISLALAVVGCLILGFDRFRHDGIIWLLAFLPLPIAFLRFGTVPYNDYWGAIYVPLVLILAPLILFKKSKN